MPDDIFDVPIIRFTNTIGTSPTVKPHLSAVNFISIWKA